MSDLKELTKRHEQISNQIKTIELENAMKRKRLNECRDEITKLGFDPDKLEVQIPAIKEKIKTRLQEIENEVNSVYKELGLSDGSSATRS